MSKHQSNLFMFNRNVVNDDTESMESSDIDDNSTSDSVIKTNFKPNSILHIYSNVFC